MTTERFKELLERNENNKMQLCFEYFCEEKQSINYQTFEQTFPVWITNMLIEDVMMTGNIRAVTEKGLNKIVEYLKEKHK